MSEHVKLDPATVETIAQRANVLVLNNLIELGLENVAERVVELLRASDDFSPQRGAPRLVNARELGARRGVSRDYVYAHAAELGVVRLGGGSKPRLRFDLEAAREAMSRYASKHSEGSNVSTGAESAAPPARRRRRLPNRLPEPGSILTAKPSPRT